MRGKGAKGVEGRGGVAEGGELEDGGGDKWLCFCCWLLFLRRWVCLSADGWVVCWVKGERKRVRRIGCGRTRRLILCVFLLLFICLFLFFLLFFAFFDLGRALEQRTGGGRVGQEERIILGRADAPFRLRESQVSCARERSRAVAANRASLWSSIKTKKREQERKERRRCREEKENGEKKRSQKWQFFFYRIGDRAFCLLTTRGKVRAVRPPPPPGRHGGTGCEPKDVVLEKGVEHQGERGREWGKRRWEGGWGGGRGESEGVGMNGHPRRRSASSWLPDGQS